MDTQMNKGDMDYLKSKEIATYCDQRIAFLENLSDLDLSESTAPIKLEAFLVVVCLKGKSTININGKTFNIQPNDLMICHPNIMLGKSSISMDFKFRCICLSKEYMEQLAMIGEGNSWDIRMFLENSPVIPLSEEEVTLFCQYYDLIHSKLTGTPRAHQKELVSALLLAFLYEFRDLLERFGSVCNYTYTSAERIFNDFMNLLSSSYPKPRNVNYYADKLCLTPKYLSSVCKKISGHTASTIIDQYVTKDIQLLLKNPQKRIKDIVYELEFPNLSFFGKYVRQHLGMSPRKWREMNKN